MPGTPRSAVPSSGPPYVEHGALATAPGPLRCEGARLAVFLVRADLARLGRLCERMLRVPSGGTVDPRPLFGAVVVSFGLIERITPAPPFDSYGHVTERQTAIWVPTVVWRRPELPLPRRLRQRLRLPRFFASVLPYMWLEDPLSVATGREMYGYPKSWGYTVFPGERPEQGPPDAYRLDAYAIERYSPDSKPDRSRLLEVRPSPRAAPDTPPAQRFGSFQELLAFAAERMTEAAPEASPRIGDGSVILPGAKAPTGRAGALLRRRRLAAATGVTVPRALLRSVLRPALQQLMLKQFRSASDGSRASDQEIVRVAAVVSRFREARLLPEHELRVLPHDSHPLGAELGLSSSDVVAGFEVRFDFTIERGEVLFG